VTSASAEFDLTNPAAYHHWTDDLVRFQDLDLLGHVNNVAFCVYAESGRVRFAEDVWPGSTDGSGIGWTIVKLTVNFRAQGHYPGAIRIGTALRRLGRSSIDLVQGLFINGKCFGTTESVIVWTDVKAGTSLALPESLRQAATPYLLTGGL
jgi:acyl-CoA thioester hydrolase